MKISRNRCGCDCLNDTDPYPVNEDCYPDVSTKIGCCPDTPLARVMTVVFAGDATAYQITRSDTEPSVWEAIGVSIGGGQTIDITLECVRTTWTLNRKRYGAAGLISDTNYDAETVHCGKGQDVTTLIFPPDISTTDTTDGFEIVFVGPPGTADPASAVVNLLTDPPTVEPTDYVQEHTCCTACPEGSPTFWLVDFGCFLRAAAPLPDNPETPREFVTLAPPIMRLTRDCLFGDEACDWTARMAEPGFWGYATQTAWRHLANTPFNPDCNCGADYDPRWDSYPKVVDLDTGFEKWQPGESYWQATTNFDCDTCGTYGISTAGGSIAISGVFSQGECEILREIAAVGVDNVSFQLPQGYWTLRVDGVRTTLTFHGLDITIIYLTDAAWECFGRNTLSLFSVENPAGLTAYPPSKICMVPARSKRPPNPCETKEQQCACCDPGWDFVTKLRFNCDGQLVEIPVVLNRQTPCGADAGGTTPTAPCGCFRYSYSGTCSGTSYQFELTIYCDGTTWKVRQCCKVGAAAWVCSDQIVAFECLCSVASLGFTLSGDCCCLFTPPGPAFDCSCTPPSTLYVDVTGCGGGWDVTGAVITYDAGSNSWNTSAEPSASINAISLKCEGGTWKITIAPIPADCVTVIQGAASGTCSPFFATFSVALDSTCYPPSGCTLTVTVSE